MDIRLGAIVLAAGLAMTATAAEQGSVADPFKVIAAFDRFAEMELWPGFDATTFPIAVYDGVVALTTPAGEHPFLQGFRKISVSGFSGEPTVVRDGNAITVEAEGLTLSFDGVRVESTDRQIVITVLPAEAEE